VKAYSFSKHWHITLDAMHWQKCCTMWLLSSQGRERERGTREILLTRWFTLVLPTITLLMVKVICVQLHKSSYQHSNWNWNFLLIISWKFKTYTCPIYSYEYWLWDWRNVEGSCYDLFQGVLLSSLLGGTRGNHTISHLIDRYTKNSRAFPNETNLL
jgi:hypothetical protein